MFFVYILAFIILGVFAGGVVLGIFRARANKFTPAKVLLEGVGSGITNTFLWILCFTCISVITIALDVWLDGLSQQLKIAFVVLGSIALWVTIVIAMEKKSSSGELIIPSKAIVLIAGIPISIFIVVIVVGVYQEGLQGTVFSALSNVEMGAIFGSLSGGIAASIYIGRTFGIIAGIISIVATMAATAKLLDGFLT